MSSVERFPFVRPDGFGPWQMLRRLRRLRAGRMRGTAGVHRGGAGENQMLEILRFIFHSFWAWLGTLVLISAISAAALNWTKVIRR